MSVAPEFAPLAHIPSPATIRDVARTCTSERLAGVTVLYRPKRPAAAPVRLTRLGVAALAGVVVVLAVVLVGMARLSAPDGATAASHAGMPDTVTVRSGDSLWSIATRLAPQRDPRAELADLERLNDVRASSLVPGQQLRTH